MANYKTIAPVEGITGKLNKKDKTVFRLKFARDSDGRVICPMKKEVYVVQHPRDWKKKPAEGAEKQKLDRWSEACAKTKQILDDPEQRALWQQRWQAQLKKADSDAPIDPRTNRPKIYIKFDCYVRAKVWRELV
jgi:hypothetical protein